MPALDQADVCIVGAGPAGTVAARLLASWGWSVVLLHRPIPAPPLAESLPPSTRKLLTLIGIAPDVVAAGFFPNTGNVARWANQDRRAASASLGFHVRRDLWDAVLLASAGNAGARIVHASVRDVDIRDQAHVTAVGASGARFTIRAEYVLDCSGRTGIIARRGLRRYAAGYRTLAIASEWSSARWPKGERTHTVVESYRDGWSWSVPLSDTVRQCAVMIDPQDLATAPATGSDGRSRTGLQDAYGQALAKTRMISARTAVATQTSAAWACDATVYDCARAADGPAILVGDAASFVEPLSSAGVKKAMLSGWRAAVVTNTCLRDSQRASAAVAYHCEREHHVFQSCTRRASRFFAEAAEAHGGPFWTVRRTVLPNVSGRQALDPDEEDLLAAEDVGMALNRLLADPAAYLRVSPALRVEPAPAIEGREVVLRDAVALPGLAQPIRYVSNVDLPALVSVVSRHGDVASTLTAYRTEVNQVAAADVLRGLSLLVARRAVLHEGIRS